MNTHSSSLRLLCIVGYLFVFHAHGELALSQEPKLTVITHGWQFFGALPDWVPQMGKKILERSGGAGILLSHEPCTGEWLALPEYWRNSEVPGAHIVLLYNWAQESANPKLGWIQAAAHNLFASLLMPPESLRSADFLYRLELETWTSSRSFARSQRRAALHRFRRANIERPSCQRTTSAERHWQHARPRKSRLRRSRFAQETVHPKCSAVLPPGKNAMARTRLSPETIRKDRSDRDS